MSLIIDETELVKQMKEQAVFKDVSTGFYEYKLFGIIPVQALILAIPVILVLKGRKK